MATAVPVNAKSVRLSITHCAFTGAAVLIVLFVLCWATAAAGALNASHAFITLFTPNEVSSLTALAAGAGWALAFGAVTGALTAIFYNLFRFSVGR